jgi:hypothetical protein
VTRITLKACGVAAGWPAMNRAFPSTDKPNEGNCSTVPGQEAQMSFAARILPLSALLAAPFCTLAQAADYEIGPNLVCNTQEQVERFVALFTGDAQAAIRFVNDEEKNPTACGIVNVAYMRGAQVGMARHGEKAFEIVRILVLGVENENGLHPVRPAAFFTLFGVKEYAV